MNDKKNINNDTAYLERKKKFDELAAKEIDNNKLEEIYDELRHLLVLAVDRLEFDTLYLKWLPYLERVDEATNMLSMSIHHLRVLYSLFTVQKYKSSNPANAFPSIS